MVASDFGGETMQIVCALPCSGEQRSYLEEGFENQVQWKYIDSYEELKREEFRETEVIIGEPSLSDLVYLPKLRWIQMTWAGTDKYTGKSKDLFPEHVILTNASGVFGKVISEYVLAGILALCRNIPQYREQMRPGGFERIKGTITLEGKKALILGTGDIGQEVARKLSAFDVVCKGIRSRKGDPLPWFETCGTLQDLDDWLPDADLVICCMPGTDQTKGMFTEKRLRSCKREAVFVNVGRGSLVSLTELNQVMNEGWFSGVLLDVYETEPLPDDHPIRKQERALLTPHISGISWGDLSGTEDKILKLCRENIRLFLDHRELKNPVSFEKGYRNTENTSRLWKG